MMMMMMMMMTIMMMMSAHKIVQPIGSKQWSLYRSLIQAKSIRIVKTSAGT